MSENILALIISGGFALAGVYVGAHLKSRGEQANQARELKIRAFTKLASLKLPMTQLIQTNAEAQLLCQYYDARFHLTGAQSDLEDAKSQNSRMLSLIPEVTKVRSEFAVAVAELKIAFKLNKKINDVLMSVYQASSLYVPEVNGVYPDVVELDRWKEVNAQQISKIVNEQYAGKMELVISELYLEFQEL